MTSRYAFKSPGRGGRREGAGGKPLSAEAKHARNLRASGIETEWAVDPVEAMVELIGLSPRVAGMRPDLAERFEIVSAGEHLARFSRVFCRYNQLGEVAEDGPRLGDPVEFESFEQEFFDEALSCDALGRRIYKRAGEIIGRKNRKTTKAGILSLYFGSPADGEHRPLVIQAAGVRDQAGKLYEATKAFIDDPQYGSAPLRRLFLPSLTKIICTSIAGEIRRVAGDGDNNMSLDPHVVVMDELHTWKTPKQRENLKALTTAQGGRLDPFVLFITTEGDGDENELALLMERIESSDATEVENRRPGLTIFRNREAGLLVFRYAAPERVGGRPTTVRDVEMIKLANPAPWRTLERLAEDLADPMNDDVTKLRLYGNIRGQGAGRWISDEAWRDCFDPEEIPDGAEVVLGVDAARTRDTTALGIAWRNDDGKILTRGRVWSCRAGNPAHVLVPGGRLDNNDVRNFIRDVVMVRWQPVLLFYDERYFDTQANDLSEDGLTVVEMHQGKAEMIAAWDGFYDLIHAGETPGLGHRAIDDEIVDPVIREHVKKALGLKTERGWKVSKKDGVIDGLAAKVMATYGAEHLDEFVVSKPWAARW